MFHKNTLWAIPLLLSATLSGTAATKHPPLLKATVRFLATSTSIRGIWGPSQDVYLIELFLRGSDQPVLARLMDDNPEYHEIFLAKRLTSATGTTLKVWRDQTCDIAFDRMPLRTPPGDLLAILPERLGYQPKLWRPVQPDEILPCYQLVK